MIAAALGYKEVVSMLIQHGANLNSKDKNGNTGKPGVGPVDVFQWSFFRSPQHCTSVLWEIIPSMLESRSEPNLMTPSPSAKNGSISDRETSGNQLTQQCNRVDDDTGIHFDPF